MKYISWNKNSEVILKKKNLSLVTVTNDKFNLKKILTIFFDLEVRIVFNRQNLFWHGSFLSRFVPSMDIRRLEKYT